MSIGNETDRSLIVFVYMDKEEDQCINRWRRDKFHVQSASTEAEHDIDDNILTDKFSCDIDYSIQTDTLFRNEATRTLFNTLIGSNTCEAKLMSVIWIDREEVWIA